MSYASFLKTIPAFQSLASREAEQLASQCEPVQFQARAQILRRGDPGDAMYIIRKGEVRVPIVDENGREKFVVRLGAGEFFGEMALLGGGVRNASVRCAEPLDLLFIPRSDFAALLDRLPKMRESIEQVAESRRERAASEASADDSVSPASDR